MALDRFMERLVWWIGLENPFTPVYCSQTLEPSLDSGRNLQHNADKLPHLHLNNLTPHWSNGMCHCLIPNLAVDRQCDLIMGSLWLNHRMTLFALASRANLKDMGAMFSHNHWMAEKVCICAVESKSVILNESGCSCRWVTLGAHYLCISIHVLVLL